MSLSVVMITYNHEKFIKDAIEGVLMQKCDFNFELIISNDSSNDKTDSIIKEILDKHPRRDLVKYTKHPKNIGMIPNFQWALNNVIFDYISICEGDDVWTDEFKLQKQVDILEKNSNVGLVYANYNVIDSESRIIKKQKYEKLMPSGIVFNETVKGAFPYPLTVCFRKTLMDDLNTYMKPHYLMGDFPLFLHLTNKSEFYYLNDVVASYRRHDTSVTSNTNSYKKRILFNDSWITILKDFLSREKIKDQVLLETSKQQIFLRTKNSFEIAVNNNDTDKAKHYWDLLKKSGIPINIKFYLMFFISKLPFNFFQLYNNLKTS